MDSYPDAPTSDSVTKEVEGHCKKATFDTSKDLDIQSGTPFSQKSSKLLLVIGSMVNEYLTGQAIDFDISMDGVWNSTADLSSESGFHSKLSRDKGFS